MAKKQDMKQTKRSQNPSLKRTNENHQKLKIITSKSQPKFWTSGLLTSGRGYLGYTGIVEKRPTKDMKRPKILETGPTFRHPKLPKDLWTT